jgi:hypothetical protein
MNGHTPERRIVTQTGKLGTKVATVAITAITPPRYRMRITHKETPPSDVVGRFDKLLKAFIIGLGLAIKGIIPAAILNAMFSPAQKFSTERCQAFVRFIPGVHSVNRPVATKTPFPTKYTENEPSKRLIVICGGSNSPIAITVILVATPNDAPGTICSTIEFRSIQGRGITSIVRFNAASLIIGMVYKTIPYAKDKRALKTKTLKRFGFLSASVRHISARTNDIGNDSFS